MEFIPTAEGRILPPNRAINPEDTVTNAFYRYEYHLKDHLGNLRLACRCAEKASPASPKDSYPLIAVQENHYDPWGLDLPIPTTSDKLGGSPADRFKFQGKEEQPNIGTYDFGARQYDPKTGRMNSIDRFTEKYAHVSGYQFALNNPILNIDVNGDSAWAVTREWNKDDVKNFATFAQQRLKEYDDKKCKIDCANLSLSVLIEYSNENGLALQLTNSEGKTTFDSNSDKYTTVDKYKKDVLGGLGANDISANTFTVPKDQAQAGDMVILTAPADHIANYSSINPRKLTYGNLDSGKAAEVTTTNDWSNSNADRRGNTMKYYPDKKHVNRWNVLKY